jgi:hypothetical protein
MKYLTWRPQGLSLLWCIIENTQLCRAIAQAVSSWLSILRRAGFESGSGHGWGRFSMSTSVSPCHLFHRLFHIHHHSSSGAGIVGQIVVGIPSGLSLVQLSIQCSPQRTNKWPNSKPHWATRHQAIAKTPAKWSAYQIPSVIVVFVILVFKV